MCIHMSIFTYLCLNLISLSVCVPIAIYGHTHACMQLRLLSMRICLGVLLEALVRKLGTLAAQTSEDMEDQSDAEDDMPVRALFDSAGVCSLGSNGIQLV